MMMCKDYEELIEQYIDGEIFLPDAVQAHLLTCAHCREYKESLEYVNDTLNGMEFPIPSPQLTDDVMTFIHERERSRKKWFVPGLSPLVSAWNTLLRYVSGIEIPYVLKREAWPLAFATLAVVWGVVITPALKAEPNQSPLRQTVISFTERLRTESEKFSAQVYSIIPDLFDVQPFEDTENNSSDKEQLFNMLDQNYYPSSRLPKA